MGTITKVIDPNRNETRAEYDAFGRLIKLIKPGDSVALPTVQAFYYDNEQPFRYLVVYREVGGTAAVRPIQHFYNGLGQEIQTRVKSLNGRQNIIADKIYDSWAALAVNYNRAI